MLASVFITLKSVLSMPSTQRISQTPVLFLLILWNSREKPSIALWTLPEINLWYCSEQRDPGS